MPTTLLLLQQPIHSSLTATRQDRMLGIMRTVHEYFWHTWTPGRAACGTLHENVAGAGDHSSRNASTTAMPSLQPPQMVQSRLCNECKRKRERERFTSAFPMVPVFKADFKTAEIANQGNQHDSVPFSGHSASTACQHRGSTASAAVKIPTDVMTVLNFAFCVQPALPLIDVPRVKGSNGHLAGNTAHGDPTCRVTAAPECGRNAAAASAADETDGSNGHRERHTPHGDPGC